MSNPKIQHITDQEFKTNVLEAKGPILVDFWAEWCGPCKALAPALDELADDFDGKAKVIKIDIDANPETPAQYGVRSIPTVLLFKDGQLLEQFVGRKNKDAYAEILKKHSD